jgi:uncharacterized protein YndB with AHSA1/START domain
VIDVSTSIHAVPARVFAAFFDPAALSVWWQVVRSVTVPKLFGVYAVEWAATTHRDDVFGPLGGVFHGRVVDIREGQEFFVADAWWMPPESNPLGPMGLQVTCGEEAGGCRLRVRQQGGDDSLRWRHYYAIVGSGWRSSLETLRQNLEQAAR